MSERDRHAPCVDQWLARLPDDADAATVVTCAARALVALWTRANGTLGDVTMTVILRRVLHTSVARFPSLAPLSLQADRKLLHDVDATPVMDADANELRAAARFMVHELLSVTGTLTGDVLTPTLHAELARAPVPTRPPRSPRRRPSAPDSSEQEKPKP